LERALVELDFFALVGAGLRVRLAPFEPVRGLDRFAEPLLLELEDPLDELFGLVAFLRVVLAVCAISVSLRGRCLARLARPPYLFFLRVFSIAPAMSDACCP
jgi:hypothetical protein